MSCGDAGCHLDMQLLHECVGQAFIEVQRADTKATTLCGVAGGLLALSVAVLSQAWSVSRVMVWSLVVVCLLLAASVGVALLALRPVMPAVGLHAELADGWNPHDGQRPASDGSPVGATTKRRREERRLWVLSRLADRKLRLVRFAGDLILVTLPVAGMGLLSGYAFN